MMSGDFFIHQLQHCCDGQSRQQESIFGWYQTDWSKLTKRGKKIKPSQFFLRACNNGQWLIIVAGAADIFGVSRVSQIFL